MPATITLQPGQRELLAQALADAVYYRDPPVHCLACDALEAQRALCEQCAATLARATAYLDLGRELGLEAPGNSSGTSKCQRPAARPSRDDLAPRRYGDRASQSLNSG